MDSFDAMKKMLSALTLNLDDEKTALSALQGMIAAEITGRRIDLGMTQKDLAHFLGISQSTLSKWESGETNFTLSTLVSIACKLDIEMQSPYVPTPPITYQSAYSNIIVLPTNGWNTMSSVLPTRETKTETEPFLKEM
jgi:Predicted transcriptional regulators